MRRRILLLVVGMTTLVVVAFAVPMAFLIRSTVVQRTETSTRDQARGIATTLVNSTQSRAQLTRYVAQQRADSGRPVSITLPDLSRVGSTPADTSGPRSTRGYGGGFPGGSPPPGGNDNGGRRPTEAQLQGAADGQVAVAFAGTSDGAYVVRVYLSADARYSGATTLYLVLGGAAIVLIAVGVVAGELLTRRIARPLVETAATAQRLSHGDVKARAPTEGPAEVADVGRALNRLADRIDQLIAEERETVADLSHRLRTPLTALRLDAEALHDPGEAERVGAHVSALERMLTAVIHAARRPQREGRMPSCDATAVVAERVEFWSALTEEQDRPASVSLPASPVPVRAAGEDLAAAVDALIENVVAHTPEGTAFAVVLERAPNGGTLTVTDDGPGLPADSPVRGRSDRGSTGLGLSIAARCAEASGGAMMLGASASGGARVVLELGGA